ncbi:hypothetical protein [Fibrella forsythiae]|uniref:Uncharacterized protein n=1 Tax=Fibrella forsythiae TaxID=2817061 RepID=A0ABS3JKT0_9BACT|nr:hypothetical protein [Fibrella forsythiae]MBO0950620.1 hypothetical protein [Fibrella forsythiae]
MKARLQIFLIWPLTGCIIALLFNSEIKAQTTVPTNLVDMPHYVVIGPNPDIQNIQFPAGYNLIVLGGILTERLRVATRSGQYWADYVFKPNYHLAPLSEVKAYIATHGHLPGIPSAQQVEREGIDVAQTQAKLLEKIEELTLHMIRQQEEINRLKKAVRLRGKSTHR